MNTQAAGALTGLRVVELASEHGAFAGKILADLGAEVILVEPHEGHATRQFEPFLDDVPGAERSLWWWHYNTGKLGVTLDLDDATDRRRFTELVASCDAVLEGEAPGRLSALGLDYADLSPRRPTLVWTSITPFGRTGARAREPATDLTILAGAGAAWSCGYDDHRLPPVRPGGNQGYHTACLWAVEATLAAVYASQTLGLGQHIDHEHACRHQRDDRGRNLRMVGRPGDGATPDVPTCRGAADTRTPPHGCRRGAGHRCASAGIPQSSGPWSIGSESWA